MKTHEDCVDKLRFSIYGNCQAAAIAGQLLSYPHFAARYEYVPLEPCFSVTADRLRDWIEKQRGSLSLLIAHALAPGWRDGNAQFDVATVAQALSGTGHLLRYTDLYFRGVNPLLVYPRGLARPTHCDYLDLVSLTLAAHGFADPALCARLYGDPELLEPSDRKAIFVLAVTELARRESGLEIRIAQAIAELCRRKPAFHTFNHPGNAVLDAVARAVLATIVVPAERVTAPAGELLGTVHFPLPMSLVSGWYREAPESAIRTVTLEQGGPIELQAYFKLALSALAPYSATDLQRELAQQRDDAISGLVIAAVERRLADVLGTSRASLREMGRLNAQGITPDFVLTKADPQAMGFMIDILGALRGLLLPRYAGATFSVLDIGAKTGAGSQLVAYLGQGASFSKVKLGVTAADIDPTFRDYAPLRNPNIEYLVGDVFETGRTWDIVICSHVVEHVPDPLHFVARLRTIAKRYIVLAFPYVEDPAQLLPGHLHSLGHDFLRAVAPARYEVYEGMFWSQSLCCIAVIEVGT